MSRWRKRGADAEAIGRSRGGRSTKIHAVVDGCGRPIALRITPGQRGDAPVAVPLLTRLPASRLCAADTAYDSDTYATSSPPAARSRSFPTILLESACSPSTPLPTSAG
ncbi:transposase, partial [Rhizobium ruizarguesonis]